MTRKLLILLTLIALCAGTALAQDESEDEPPDCPSFEGSSAEVRTGYYMGEGEGFTRSGQVQSAIFSYTCIIEVIDDDYLPAYVRRAVLYTQRREYELAIEDYAAIIQRDSGSVAAHNNRGIVYALMADYESALEDFNDAVELDSEFVIGLNNRAVLYALQGDYQAALDDLDAAIEISGIDDILALIRDPERDDEEEIPEFTRADSLSFALRGIVRSWQALDNYNDYMTLTGGGDNRIQSAAGALESRFTFELRLDDGAWLMTASFPDEEAK
jgi:tetratricopeptide (TPR) repeat protein